MTYTSTHAFTNVSQAWNPKKGLEPKPLNDTRGKSPKNRNAGSPEYARSKVADNGAGALSDVQMTFSNGVRNKSKAVQDPAESAELGLDASSDLPRKKVANSSSRLLKHATPSTTSFPRRRRTQNTVAHDAGDAHGDEADMLPNGDDTVDSVQQLSRRRSVVGKGTDAQRCGLVLHSSGLNNGMTVDAQLKTDEKQTESCIERCSVVNLSAEATRPVQGSLTAGARIEAELDLGDGQTEWYLGSVTRVHDVKNSFHALFVVADMQPVELKFSLKEQGDSWRWPLKPSTQSPAVRIALALIWI